MNGSRGSISLGLLLVSLTIAMTAHLALLWSRSELQKTQAAVCSGQLQAFCRSCFSILQAERRPAGEWVCARGILQPGNIPVEAAVKSEYSNDGLLHFLEVRAAAAGNVGAVQRLCRMHMLFGEATQRISGSFALAAKNFAGLEYMTADTPYIQASEEEVRLPQISFFHNRIQASLTAGDAVSQGLNAQFHYLPSSSTFSFRSGGAVRGAAAVACHGSIVVGSGCHFPDRLLLVSDAGNITLQRGARLDKALIMAYGSVTIESGCRINGLVAANRIVLKGVSAFTADASVTEPFASSAFMVF